MNGTNRRQRILQMLGTDKPPVSGTSLAKQFSVSRQIIVQDIAIIRAEGHDVISTNRGYILNKPVHIRREMRVFHTNEEIEDELNTLVDLGGIVDDHKAYGTISAKLNITSRLDVRRFLDKIVTGECAPLKDVTAGYHFHTVTADSEETLDLIESTLLNKGFLCPLESE